MTKSGEQKVCGSTETKSGDPCQRPAGWGTSHNGEGRCDDHPGRGAPEGNDNAVGNDGGNPDAAGVNIDHGARADPMNLYDHLGEEATAWVDSKVEAYLDKADLSLDTPSGDLVEMAVVTMYQARSAHAELAKEGLGRTKVVGVSEIGEPITDEEEHYLNKIISRHSTDFRMFLKDAGALDDPESQKADAIGDLSSIILNESDS